MKKLCFSIAFSLLTSQPLFALLSPLDQSVTELQSILKSSELKKHLHTSEVIQDIWKVDDRYIISTLKRQMVVQVVYSARNTPGPQEFNLIFHAPQNIGE